MRSVPQDVILLTKMSNDNNDILGDTNRADVVRMHPGHISFDRVF